MVLTTRSSGDIFRLFSALAAADLIVRATSVAAFCGILRRIARARSTGFPRTTSTTSRTFCGEMRTPRRTAFASTLVPLFHLAALVGLLAAMPAEEAGWREFTQFVPN